jgi:4-diphosphocytidyl-2-C-methyl-D-erythritol kinase
MAIQSLLDVPAPAKLNLFLHVLGRRPDGYHLLQSAFVLIDWCDTLHFERRGDGLLRRHDLNDDAQPLPASDLCLRAAQALQAASGCALGCDISIDKRLPSGAGMGGGSSDAATVLLALNRLWGLNWPRRQLQAVALPLGADVPFFVGGDNAWAEGIGERLTPLALRPHRLAVVKPPCHVDTGTIFNSQHLVRQNEPAILAGFLARESIASDTALAEDGAAVGANERTANAGMIDQVLDPRAASPWPTDVLFHGFGRNDLQPAAEAEFPQVAQAAGLLRQLFGNSRMTGSGSAVFANLEEPFIGVRRQERMDDDGEGAHTAAEAALQG